MPRHFYHKIEKKIIREIEKYAVILQIPIGTDSEFDDKILIGYCKVTDANYVSNDKNMSTHFKENNVVVRDWCQSHRIGFTFDKQEKFIPNSSTPPHNNNTEKAILFTTHQEVME